MQEQPSHNSLWFLMARTLSGESSIAEEQQLMEVLAQDISLQQQYELMKRMWHAGDKANKETVEADEKGLSRILLLTKSGIVAGEDIPAIQSRSRRKLLYAISSIAAVIILLMSVWLATGTAKIQTVAAIKMQVLTAENGSRTQTILPDGSKVWLNAGSHISYDENFSGPLREVTLEGEAYFDVVKQVQRPFIVHVANYDIKVLGTAFNVKSYNTDKTVETTLLRGLVQVSKHGKLKQQPILLHPNQKLIVEKVAANEHEKLPDMGAPAKKISDSEPPYVITPLNDALKENERIETAWVYNRLQFRGENFVELAGKLERWYNMEIIFDDDDVQQLHFTGSFENETIEQAFAALRTAKAFAFQIKGKEIHISSAVH